MTDATDNICPICKKPVQFSIDKAMVGSGGKFWHKPCFKAQEDMDFKSQRVAALIDRITEAADNHAKIYMDMEGKLAEADASTGAAWRLLRRYKSRVRFLNAEIERLTNADHGALE